MGQKAAMKTPGTIQLNMHLPAKIIKKRDIFISHCPTLDVCSQGNTEEEAKHNLIEAITAFVISCFNRGTLEEVLKDCGFSPINDAAKKQVKSRGVDYIDVPIPLIAAHQNQQAQCHT